MPAHSADLRLGRDLLQATVPFATESSARSWRHVGTAFALMLAALLAAGGAGGLAAADRLRHPGRLADVAILWWNGGFDTAFFAVLLPMTLPSREAEGIS